MKAELTVVSEGRFLCVQVTNLGAPAMFSAVVQPGRGTASAAVAKTALWHDSTNTERHLETGQSALIRIAQRDRPPTADEHDDQALRHPEGTQAWRMCFLRPGAAAVERLCPVVRRDGSPELDGIVLTVVSDRQMKVRTVSLEGDVATDELSQRQYRVLDSPRHYHGRPRP
jgi:hypothetical protein